MPRIRSNLLETRENRRRLKVRKKFYAKSVFKGLRLLYRKNQSGGIWFGEKYNGQGGYQNLGNLGTADDYSQANNETILSYDEACRKLLTLGDEQIRQDKGLPPSEITVRSALTSYLEDYKARSRSRPSSKRVAELIIEKSIIPKLGSVPLSDLTQARVRSWFNGLVKLSDDEKKLPDANVILRKRQATANRIRTVLMAALNFAHNNGFANAEKLSEWRKIKPFRAVDAPRIRFLTPEQSKIFITHCDDEFKPLVIAALLTGGRFSEITDLKVEDYDPELGLVFFARGKSGKERYVPLNNEGQRFFDSIRMDKLNNKHLFLKKNGKPWKKSEQARPMKRACKAAEFSPAVSFHDLRHTFGAQLATKGVPMKAIAETLGHSDTRITERHYAHFHQETKYELIRASLEPLGVQLVKAISLDVA